MSLTLQRIQIKKLNDRLLNQNILIQTLMDVILDSGIVSEEELENRLDTNLKKTNDILESFEKEVIEHTKDKPKPVHDVKAIVDNEDSGLSFVNKQPAAKS